MSDFEAAVFVGAKRFRKDLKAAGGDLADLKRAHLDAARIVANAAKSSTPRDTGALAKTVRPGGSRTAGIVRAGNNTSVVYANPIHWGWPSRGQAAQPWLSQAAQRTESRWLQEFVNLVGDALENCDENYTGGLG